jgi:hypothetical protein
METLLPIKHLTHDKQEKTFHGRVIKKTDDYGLVLPEQQFFVQMVKFAPGKGPDDYVHAYEAADDEFKKVYGKTRCDMGIHEVVTFVIYGRYDLAVIWYAPNIETYDKYLAILLSMGNDFGSTETQPSMSVLIHF